MTHLITGYEIEVFNDRKKPIDPELALASGAQRILAVMRHHDSIMERFIAAGYNINEIRTETAQGEGLAAMVYKSDSLSELFDELTVEQQWDLYKSSGVFSTQNLIAYLILHKYGRLNKIIMLEKSTEGYLDFHQTIADCADRHFCDTPLTKKFIDEVLENFEVQTYSRKRWDIVTIISLARGLFGDATVLEVAQTINNIRGTDRGKSDYSLIDIVKILIAVDQHRELPTEWIINVLNFDEVTSDSIHFAKVV